MKLIKDVVAKLEKKLNDIPLMFKLYAWPYKAILKKEIDLAQITADDVVLNVGCGAMPFSAVYLAELTGAKVLALDRDQEVIDRAESCIQNLGLEDKIEVLEGDAIEFEPPEFTVALIALQAEPKVDILNNLLANAKKGARLIFRQPRDYFEDQYDYLPTDYQPDALKRQKMITFDRSVLFTKEVSNVQ
ncbi:SAM-dependent methyltransferase [Natroniella sp. ANB-PHB2]|uniref:SAM-dependent methyltransferase n=1 Tax=Natroniella sp. ANB-PHB2 TaxID=3384444 RepID=UPI0038D516DD